MKKLLLFSIAIINSYFSLCQPAIQWQKSLGGTGRDLLNAVLETNDGGYIVSGYSDSNNGDVTGNHGANDYWIVKVDASNTIQWQKSFGGSADDYLKCIQQTNDGGYILGGKSFSNNGDVTGHHGATNTSDYWIVKIDAIGNLQWQKSLGGSDNENFVSLKQTIDGGFIIGGDSESNDGDVSGNHAWGDYWVVKLDVTGIIQWQKPFGGTSADYLSIIHQTTDGGYIVG